MYLPWTACILLLGHDGGGVEELERVAARHVAPLAGDAVALVVAVLAGDLHVRRVAGEVGIQRTTAVSAGEAFLVVNIVEANHLLCWKHLDGLEITR